MKTIILSMSPRKSFSASMYYSKVFKFFMKKGDVELLELKTQKQYLDVISRMNSVDNIVLAAPVYVDTIPSTVLEMLAKIENHVKGKSLKINVYTIINCGFYEGEQCELAQKTVELWCEKCGFNFCGGLSIGAGVMLAFIRTLIPIGLIITIIEILIFAVIAFAKTGNIAVQDILHFPSTLAVQTLLYVLWSMGLFVNSFKMAQAVKNSNKIQIVNTGLWFCPRFLFVIMASIYWVLASVFWYKGKFWRILKEPKI